VLAGETQFRPGNIVRGETPLRRAFARCFPAGKQIQIHLVGGRSRSRDSPFTIADASVVLPEEDRTQGNLVGGLLFIYVIP
jgi:hypothetical protein